MNNVIKAGCILIDKNNKKVALVYRDKYNDYTFPKGHLENNETIIECAIRETEEETKRIPIIDSKFNNFKLEYNNMEGDVIIYYYIAYDGGLSDNSSLDTHPVIWVNYNDVYNKLSYDGEKLLWNSVKELIND